MSERKGLTKYYPPDFDPSKLSRVKAPKDGKVSSHFMLPMSVRCLTCGEFMGAGLKFNAKKSTAAETYLGTKIFRFEMKCKACPAGFVIKTDPEHGDYLCEAGAKRNFEAWRDDKEKGDEAAAVREEQDLDAMQALENKTMDARKEMEDLDALAELRASNARSAAVSADALLDRLRANHDGEEAIEEEAREAFRRKHDLVRGVDVDGRRGGEDAAPAGSASAKRKAESAAQPTAAPPLVVKKKAKLSGLVAYASNASASSSSSSSSSSAS